MRLKINSSDCTFTYLLYSPRRGVIQLFSYCFESWYCLELDKGQYLQKSIYNFTGSWKKKERWSDRIKYLGRSRKNKQYLISQSWTNYFHDISHRPDYQEYSLFHANQFIILSSCTDNPSMFFFFYLRNASWIFTHIIDTQSS